MTEAVALNAPLAAVIVELPLAAGVTVPFVTVATSPFDELHATA
jgi:hypothetical protein